MRKSKVVIDRKSGTVTVQLSRPVPSGVKHEGQAIMMDEIVLEDQITIAGIGRGRKNIPDIVAATGLSNEEATMVAMSEQCGGPDRAVIMKMSPRDFTALSVAIESIMGLEEPEVEGGPEATPTVPKSGTDTR